MRRYVLLVGILLTLFLLAFVAVEAWQVPLLVDPTAALAAGGPAAVLGVGLLVADVVLPVPSSLVMIAHGALFGAVAGAALSVVGALGAALAGYALGRYGARPLVERAGSERGRRRAEAFVREWGLLAVAASRPVPLVAETVAVVAGSAGLGPVRTGAAALVGSLPAAVLYGVAGAAAVDAPSGLVVFAAVLVVAAVFWLAGRRWARGGRRSGPDPIV